MVRARRSSFVGSRLTIGVFGATLVSACATTLAERAAPVAPPSAPAVIASPATMTVPGPLVPAGFDLRLGPVPVPLRLLLPSLGVEAAVIGVGVTPKNVMDAPMGSAEDPVWQQAFWYRGSAVPGAVSTALIAGHINGPRGRSAVFASLDRLRPGDPVVVRNTTTGLDVRFVVNGSTTYPLEQADDPAVLAQIYGAGPVAGTGPQPSSDGIARLTLLTCAGTFTNGTHDHRLVVSATRV